MLASAFKQNQPAVLFLLVLVVPLLWPGSSLDAPMAAASLRQGMPLYQLVAPLWSTHWIVQAAVGMLLTAGIALGLDRFSNGAELFDRRNHLPALLFPLVMVLGPTGLWVEPALLGLPWVLWSISRAWSVQGRASALGALFDAGLLMGIAGLWYLPYLFLIVVIWASVSVMRPFYWRDHVLPVIGLALALFLCWGTLLVFDLDLWHPIRSTRNPAPAPGAMVPMVRKVLAAVVLVPLALGSFSAFLSLYQRSIMREKNVRSAFLALALAMLILIGFEWLLNGTFPSALLAAPVAVLFAHPLLHMRRGLLAEVVVTMLFGLALWARWA